MNGPIRSELHDPVPLGIKSKVVAAANKIPGPKLRAPLANDDASGLDKLPAGGFDPETLGLRIASVRRTPLCFGMRHF